LVSDNLITAETISGGRCVTINSSGALVIAMAAMSGREESVGIVVDNVLSGQPVNRYYGGRLFNTQLNLSGGAGNPIWMGLSGELVVTNQPLALGSGNNQVVGVGISNSGMIVLPSVIGSGNVGRYRLSSGAVMSGHIASGQIGSFHLASGSVTSGRVASGSLSQFVLGSGAVQSGHTASGNINTYSRNLFYDMFTAAETISGVRCVRVTASGLLQIAMAAVSGRMPSDGVMLTNVLSGSVGRFLAAGYSLGVASEIGSGLCISGRAGSTLFVGASGQVVTISGGGPTIGVGATNSGAMGQMLGRTAGSGAILLEIDRRLASGAAVITTDSQYWPL
jgi:hypothetical protein